MSVHICHTVSPELTAEEAALLREIGQSRRYPVCRFELRCTREAELVSTALNAVHLQSAQDTMYSIKARAALLLKLEEKGLIVLYYGLKTFVKSDYQMYHDSDVFAQLCQLAQEGAKREGYLFDYACVKKGIAVLTVRGKYALSK